MNRGYRQDRLDKRREPPVFGFESSRRALAPGSRKINNRVTVGGHLLEQARNNFRFWSDGGSLGMSEPWQGTPPFSRLSLVLVRISSHAVRLKVPFYPPRLLRFLAPFSPETLVVSASHRLCPEGHRP
jgi:hypothetical protein